MAMILRAEQMVRNVYVDGWRICADHRPTDLDAVDFLDSRRPLGKGARIVQTWPLRQP